MTPHSDALVEELARIHAIAWECHDVSPTANIEPDVDDHDRAAMCAVLDHLMELGWRENCGAATRGGDPAVCALPRGHQDQRHADGNGVTWGACSLDRRADGTTP